MNTLTTVTNPGIPVFKADGGVPRLSFGYWLTIHLPDDAPVAWLQGVIAACEDGIAQVEAAGDRLRAAVEEETS